VSGEHEQTACLDKLTLDDGHDGALLDGRGALETVGVDTTEELSLEVHGIERVGGLVVVGLDLSCSAGMWSAHVVMEGARQIVAALVVVASA
jgi:hypothetical protein